MSPEHGEGRPRGGTANRRNSNTSEKNSRTNESATSVPEAGVRPRDWSRLLHTTCRRCGRPLQGVAPFCWCPAFLHPLKSGRSRSLSMVLAVASVLADHADRRGYVETTAVVVATEAGVSPRTARRALLFLAEQGFLDHRRRGTRFAPAAYRLTRPAAGGDRHE